MNLDSSRKLKKLLDEYETLILLRGNLNTRGLSGVTIQIRAGYSKDDTYPIYDESLIEDFIKVLDTHIFEYEKKIQMFMEKERERNHEEGKYY